MNNLFYINGNCELKLNNGIELIILTSLAISVIYNIPAERNFHQPFFKKP